MSTSTTAPAVAAPSPAGNTGLTFGGVLKSEWIKFRSLMSTRLLLIGAFIAVIGVGTLAAWLRGTVIRQIMQFGPRGERLPGSRAHDGVRCRTGTAAGLPDLRRPQCGPAAGHPGPRVARRALHLLRIRHRHDPLHHDGGPAAAARLRRQGDRPGGRLLRADRRGRVHHLPGLHSDPESLRGEHEPRSATAFWRASSWAGCMWPALR